MSWQGVLSVFDFVAPQTADEVSRVFIDSVREGRTVSFDCPGGDLVISTAKMNRVIEHEPTDLTCIVEPGIKLSELNEIVAAHGQQLSLDPPGDPTIGECILKSLSGPRRHHYGAVRDLILGVTVVLGDGTVASSGGKVVKNVAGYDLAKLFCGSRGTLGLVVRAAFRLHPRPETSATFEVQVERPSEGRMMVRRLQQSSLVLSALDIAWPGRLFALLEGSTQAVSAQLDEAMSLVRTTSVSDKVWESVLEQQGRAKGTLVFSPGDIESVLHTEQVALVRPSVGVAYIDRTMETQQSPSLMELHERIRRAFDPEGIFVV